MRVYIKSEEGKVVVYDAVKNEKLKEFSDMAEAVKFAIENHYQLPAQAFNGEFITDKEGNFVYVDDKGLFELADGTLLEGVKRCPQCGWIAYGEEVCDEDKQPRECFVCPKCGYVFDCTPAPDELPAED